MSKINTNMAGVTTLYHLRNKEDAMNQALERISSGLRINNAVDDAAGASLVNRMTSQVKGLEAAIRNAADAISLRKQRKVPLTSIIYSASLRELSVQAQMEFTLAKIVRLFKTKLDSFNLNWQELQKNLPLTR